MTGGTIIIQVSGQMVGRRTCDIVTFRRPRPSVARFDSLYLSVPWDREVRAIYAAPGGILRLDLPSTCSNLLYRFKDLVPGASSNPGEVAGEVAKTLDLTLVCRQLRCLDILGSACFEHRAVQGILRTAEVASLPETCAWASNGDIV